MKAQAIRIANWTLDQRAAQAVPVTAASALPGRRPNASFWTACSGCLALWILVGLILGVL